MSTLGMESVERHFLEAPARNDHHSSGVSWGAVIGGAFVAAAISLIMLALGAGFGLSVVSPWSNAGASAATVGAAAIAWLIVNEIVASALGGYLTGRLRIKWVAVHTDEVYFRDTANGFLAWAVAVVATAAFLASSASVMASNPAQPEAAVDTLSYFVDGLFRSDAPNAQPADVTVRAEAEGILANSLKHEDASGADQAYLARLISSKTGLSEADAGKRVSQIITQARQAADSARRAASKLLLWIFVALLTGAFSASYAATIGGRQRDHVKAI